MISVVIPVYKNSAPFLKLLKHNLKFFKQAQIIIVNDNPEENLDTQIKAIAPQAKVINNSKNYGFGKSMNLGVAQSSYEFLLFLNSDVKLLDSDFLKVTKMFTENKSLFALTFGQIEENKRLTGANAGKFSQGMFHHFERFTNKVSENLWPEGGSSLIRKSYFLKLSGFDEIYSPFYWEDVDLGYRAKQRGWTTLFYPLIKVEHHHQTTISKYFSQSKIKTIAFRNQFLFVWKNMCFSQLFQHWLFMPILLFQNRHNFEFKQGLKQAIAVWWQKK